MQGYMHRNQMKDLRSTAKSVGKVHWVEVGVWRGLSAMAVYDALTPGSTMHLVDPYDPRYWPDCLKDEARRGDPPFVSLANAVEEHWVPSKPIHIHRCTSKEASGRIPFPDIVFIDGSHEYNDVLTDLTAWGHITMRMIMGHDWDIAGVRKAVIDYCRNPALNNRWKLVDQRHDIWYLWPKG